MKKTRKRGLALLLVLAMLAGMLPLRAFAGEEGVVRADAAAEEGDLYHQRPRRCRHRHEEVLRQQGSEVYDHERGPELGVRRGGPCASSKFLSKNGSCG